MEVEKTERFPVGVLSLSGLDQVTTKVSRGEKETAWTERGEGERGRGREEGEEGEVRETVEPAEEEATVQRREPEGEYVEEGVGVEERVEEDRVTSWGGEGEEGVEGGGGVRVMVRVSVEVRTRKEMGGRGGEEGGEGESAKEDMVRSGTKLLSY